ncbi:MAG: ADOP family duplicated permease, partial [Longimicrobiales bacterium]
MDFSDFRERSRSLVAMAAFKPRMVDADAGEATEPVQALMVTPSYFELLGASPLHGRFFSPEVEDGPGAHPQVVLTVGLWQRWFGSDPGVLGKGIVLNGRRYTVIGVTPSDFMGTQVVEVPDLFVPMSMQPALMPESGYLLDRRSWSGIYQIGRLGEGVTLETAHSEIERLAAQLSVEHPNTNSARTYRVLSFREASMPGAMKSSVVQLGALLFAVVLSLWLVVCLNVSNLLVARSAKRRQEFSIRAALGAGRFRIGTQNLAELLTVALLAGVVGMGVAQALSATLATLPLPIFFDTSLDTRTVAFTGALAVASALVCALFPSILASTIDPRELGGATRGGSARTKRWSSRALIVSQVAVSVVLLFATGLFVRSFANLTSADPGFDASNLATGQVHPGLQGYDAEQMSDYYRRLSDAVSGIPGVSDVALADGLPSTGNFGQDSWFLQDAEDPARASSLFLSTVSTNYFQMMAIPIAAGRSFNTSDTPDQPLVVIVNEATARLVESRTGIPALGQRMSPQGPEGPFLEIVGVVGDSRTGRATEPAPFVYGAHQQLLPLGLGGQRMVVMAKTTVPPESVTGELRRVATLADPAVSASNLITMERFLDDLLVTDRLIVTVLSTSSILAVLLVALGVYGLLAYVVSQRTREFGIRVALGARAVSLRRIVVGEALGLASLGLILGTAAALVIMRLVQDQLFEVASSDPPSLIAGAALVIGVTLAAASVPARRAMKADPMTAMRVE